MKLKKKKKTYGRIDREELLSALRFYELGDRQIAKWKLFFVNSRACVRVGNGISDWFPVKVRLCQGSVNCHLTYLIPMWMVL